MCQRYPSIYQAYTLYQPMYFENKKILFFFNLIQGDLLRWESREHYFLFLTCVYCACGLKKILINKRK